MKRKMTPIAALALVFAALFLLGGSCPNRTSRTPRDTLGNMAESVRAARDRMFTPPHEFILPAGQHVLDVDINCTRADPECLTILTRPMHRREQPRTLTLHIPFASGAVPSSVTIREVARPR